MEKLNMDVRTHGKTTVEVDELGSHLSIQILNKDC